MCVYSTTTELLISQYDVFIEQHFILQGKFTRIDRLRPITTKSQLRPKGVWERVVYRTKTVRNTDKWENTRLECEEKWF